MPDGQGNSAAVTTLEYYDDSAEQQHARGQLRLVIDANDVHHYYEYDKWGYVERSYEGLVQQGGRSLGDDFVNPVSYEVDHNGTGGPVTVCIGNGCCGDKAYNALGLPMLCDIRCTGAGAPFTRLGSVPAPEVSPLIECFSNADYNIVGRLEYVRRCEPWSEASLYRAYDPEYDDLGRVSSYTVQSGVGGDTPWEIERTFEVLEYDANGRPLRVQGPDGQVTQYTASGVPGYDALGRPGTVTRSGMSATFTYDAASRLTQVDYANGTKIVRHYDDADRLDWIEHRGLLDVVLLSIDYDWNANNTLASRTEVDYTTQPTETVVVSFGYDNRDQLISESRVVNSTATYDIAYKYDQLGNRTEKQNCVAGTKTCYVYDTNWNPNLETPAWDEDLCFEPDAPEFDTRNNRLLEYREYTSGDPLTLTRSVRYTYYQIGHVSNITIKDEGVGAEYDWCRDLAFYYTSAGRLWRVLWDQWQEDAQGDIIPGTHTKLAAREFYYDNSRARYLARDVDPNNDWQPIGDWLWTDYAGVQPYSDFTTDASHVVTEAKRYLSKGGTCAQQTVSTSNTEYLHGDLINSTVLTTDDTGAPEGRLSYTAFGQPVGDASQLDARYQYAGGWGYESNLLTLDGAPGTASISLHHLGWRWYEAGAGRFVQRDPIGIGGGVNVYSYCANDPPSCADPTGLDPGLGICEYCGRMVGHAPDCPLYVKPAPRRPQPPARPLQPEEELERLRKKQFLGEGMILLGSPWSWILAPGVFCAHVVDELIHWDEPLNPLLGGNYDNWQP